MFPSGRIAHRNGQLDCIAFSGRLSESLFQISCVRGFVGGIVEAERYIRLGKQDNPPPGLIRHAPVAYGVGARSALAAYMSITSQFILLSY